MDEKTIARLETVVGYVGHIMQTFPGFKHTASLLIEDAF
jgi:hypothetical protein